jgi:nucleolar protein 4
MREDSLKQRQTLIKSNPMLHLSFTRLSIRNIPRHISSKDLKALARDAIVGFAKNVKEGLRQPLSKEELKRGVEETRQAEMIRKKKGKGLVKQATIVFESRDGGKINEKSGAGRSRGYGFIEYFSHRHALMGLRWLNGHAIECVSEAGAKEKKKRLIVEFAIENAQVIRRRNQYQEKMRNLGEVGRADRKSDGRVDEDDTFLDKGNDQAKQGTKRKRSQSRSGAKDGKTDATESKDGKDLDRLAKRNRVIARKRLKRKMRKGKAS